MFLKTSLPAFLFLAINVGATPTPIVAVRDNLVTLPLAKKINITGSGQIVQQDKARIKQLIAKITNTVDPQQDSSVGSLPVTNQVVSYIASVGVGSPATNYDLIVDTGSSNTWVGADKQYVQTSTSTNTGASVSVGYGSGFFSGTEYIDTVTLGSLVITKQSIGVASESSGFQGVDGILGIGPVDLTDGTVSNAPTIPTVVDNLFSQGTIPADIVSVFFAPATTESSENGELTFGGTDPSKFTGSITYTPLTNTEPASFYWGIDQSITYGNTAILSNTAGIVDTGTTLLYIASDAFDRYISATGAVEDETTGLYTITSSQYSALQTLNFEIGGTTFGLTPNAQIWPRSLNSAIGGDPDSIYLVVADVGTNTGGGLDFIDGQVFLERFYSVFDTGNNRFGIATTSFTGATSN